jgi:hypothetical protein
VSDEPLGYTCGCGQFYKADAWGAAHWDIDLLHRCEECNTTNIIRSGEVIGAQTPHGKVTF